MLASGQELPQQETTSSSMALRWQMLFLWKRTGYRHSRSNSVRGASAQPTGEVHPHRCRRQQIL
jgi:hypothetical protein